MSEAAVLDASALAAVALGEPGAEVVARVLETSRINAVNLAEVLIALERRGVPTAEAASVLQMLPFETVSTDASMVPLIAEIHRLTRVRGLSLADCVCLATARKFNETAYTTDRAWTGLDVGVTIECVR